VGKTGFEPTYKANGLFTRGSYPLSLTVERLSHIRAPEGAKMQITHIGCSFINWHPAFQLTFPINSINVLKIDPELTLLY